MLKKILIGSEILEIDGEEHFKIDLKEEEKMISRMHMKLIITE